ncbi:uncharacterized protein LOC111279589 [Durio zibethinus]|uniref:Uncharacterized protein LOC111279589 n=1 Tax=Durio zibethinus TaxID=66656 RepID=A0A6P5X1R1_DURZI|nr:uncharacterized protein LOC111279589 [Durio zibethinus]
MEIQEFNEPMGVIPNLHPPLPMHASSPAGTGGVPLEQGNGKQTSFEPLAKNENEMVKADVNNLLISSAKRKKLTSDVWEEFINKKDGDGKELAICVYCDRKFDGSSKKGTTHLRNHLKRCKERATKVGRGDSKNESASEGNSSFDQDKSSMDVARMIIKHQCPLNMVEYEFFSIFLKNLQPMFKLQSQEALSSNIIHVYQEEKRKLVQNFDKLSCRFNLTISLWVHDLEKTAYCCYTVQFIDDNWELKKKILALENLGNQFNQRTFIENFKKFFEYWKFGKKVCSLTIHTSSSCFKIAEEIRKSWQCFVASYPSSSFFISSDECSFGLLGKDNSGEKNVEKSIDGGIRTSNACLRDIFGIYKKLSQRDGRGYPLMNVKFDNKCWTCSLILAIAVVLDPQFKFNFVEFSYNAIYGDEAAKIHLKMIRNTLTDIFYEYASNISSGTLFLDDTNSSTLLNAEENTMESFHRWCNSKRNTEASSMSELDNYLSQPIIISSNPDFDILGWWCEQASHFPILARMVRDILAIPVSSIISSSTFNEKIFMDNPIFSGLDPQIIEAMICGRDWLESPKEDDRVNLAPMQNRAKRKMEEKETFVMKSCKKGTTIWTEKDVEAYLRFPFTEKEREHLSKWQTHAISGESVGQDKIPLSALVPLLRIPPHDVDSTNAPNYYIKDTVVNQFFVLLKRRYEKFPHEYIKHHSFDSCIADFLIKGSRTEDEVLSRVKKEDFKGVSKLFLPICLNKHWLLFYADIDDKKLLWLDSIENSRMSNDSEKHIIRRWFLEFLLPLSGHDHKDWSFDVPENIPMQKNSVDCALFVMKYADCLTHGNYFPFTQDDMPHFRRRTFLDLYHGSVCLGGSQDDRAKHAPLPNKAKSKRKMDEKESISLVKISKNWNSEETNSTGDYAKDSDLNDGDPSLDNWLELQSSASESAGEEVVSMEASVCSRNTLEMSK